jgi:GTPase SAR1 family protein
MSEMQEPFQELNAGIVAADDTVTDGITDDEFLQFRQKCQRFRVLVIGSSDVGKTTLLERFTGDSIDGAQIKSPDGELVRICRVSHVTVRTCLNTRSFSFTSHLKKTRR